MHLGRDVLSAPFAHYRVVTESGFRKLPHSTGIGEEKTKLCTKIIHTNLSTGLNRESRVFASRDRKTS